MAEVTLKTRYGNVKGVLNDVGKDHVFLLVHGFQANKITKQFDAVEHMMLGNGISTLRIDLFGHGDDRKNFESLTVTKAIESVRESVSFLSATGFKQIGILGSSFGGLVSFFTAAGNTHVSLLILKSPVLFDQGGLILKFKNIDKTQWQKKGTAEWGDAHGIHSLNFQFYKDANTYDATEIKNRVTAPLLIVHGGKDSIVPVQQSKGLLGMKNLRLEIIDSADHKLNDAEMSQFVEKCRQFIVKEWNIGRSKPEQVK
ncbi:alpha/beta hydrolase [Candidatus Woesearchaeota archaeon]|nr:alpha/beta hydrolase [Candidatus Woesearchaeota archaeon]